MTSSNVDDYYYRNLDDDTIDFEENTSNFDTGVFCDTTNTLADNLNCGPHRCAKAPGHTDVHRCPCGETWT